MTEKNREILSKAISEMPLRKPKGSNWGGISNGLDQLDASAFISKNANKLPGYTAPTDTWNKITAGLAAPTASFFSTWIGKTTMGVLFVGAILAGYLLLVSPEEQNDLIVDREPVKEEAPFGNTPFPTKTEKTEGTIVQPKDNEELPEKSEPPPPQEPQKPARNVQTSLPPLPEKDSQSPSDASIRNENIIILPLIWAPVIISVDSTSIDPMVNEEKKKQSDMVEYAKDMNKGRFLIGAFYSYKHYQHAEQEGMSIPQSLSSFGVDFSYEKHKWFFKTGIEYVSWKEKGNYSVGYDQNQMVYEYNYVDSTYIDPENNHVTYFTTENFVYDSVSMQKIEESSYEYRILQIPIILGYNIIDHGKFRMGIIGGVGFDIRLSGKQFIPVFNEEESTITDINNTLQYRTNNNWRLILGLDLAYNFTRKWEVYAEPGYQWYMKPIYTPDNTKGIGLMNIKIGFRYIF